MLSTLNSTLTRQQVPQNGEKKTFILEVSNKIQRAFLPKVVQMTLGPFSEKIPLCYVIFPHQSIR